MRPPILTANGDPSPSVVRWAEVLTNLRDGETDDASLFSLFASIAREAGREDLYAEFTRRAAGSSESLSPPAMPTRAQPASAEAERQHKEGCRLVREGKPAEA